jgi:hypothetical protein
MIFPADNKAYCSLVDLADLIQLKRNSAILFYEKILEGLENNPSFRRCEEFYYL